MKSVLAKDLVVDNTYYDIPDKIQGVAMVYKGLSDQGNFMFFCTKRR